MRYVLLLVLLVGCEDPFAPPPNAVAMEPLPIYRHWWAKVEACSGLTGDIDRIRWYVVPAGSLVWDGLPARGVWEPPHDIYLDSRRVAYDFTVQHEMLHDLVGRAGHPAVFDACGLR